MSYQVDRTRWADLSIFEQMGNIGSEVGRSIKAKQTGDLSSFEGALERTLDLFNATTKVLIAQKSPRAREVLRACDQYLELFYGDKDSMKDATKLENYFMEFAMLARR